MMAMYIISVLAILFLLCGLKAYGLFNRQAEKNYEQMIYKDVPEKGPLVCKNEEGKET